MKNRRRMSVKFLAQLTLPMCFHVMRAAAADDYDSDVEVKRRRRSRPPPPDPIKLIKSDGQVSVYHRPVHVSELMSEFPKHLVCHSDSFYIGRKIPAMSETDQLQLGQKYFLLPSHLFQTVLSFVSIASFVSSDAPAAKKAAAARLQLFEIHRTPSGSLRIRVSDDFISQLTEESSADAANAAAKECGGGSRVCTTARLEKEYEQLVGGSRDRRWKPKLEAIKEKPETKKKKRRSFSIKRRKNSSSHHLPESDSSKKQVLKPSTKKKSFPRPKFRMRLRK